MNKTKSIWDEIAAEQARVCALAAGARKKIKLLNSLSTPDLVEIFIALCRTDEQFDKGCKIREKILGQLPDHVLFDFAGLRMPSRVAYKIERRLKMPATAASGEETSTCDNV